MAATGAAVLWRKRRDSRGAEDEGRKRRPLWSEEVRSIVRRSDLKISERRQTKHSVFHFLGSLLRKATASSLAGAGGRFELVVLEPAADALCSCRGDSKLPTKRDDEDGFPLDSLGAVFFGSSGIAATADDDADDARNPSLCSLLSRDLGSIQSVLRRCRIDASFP